MPIGCGDGRERYQERTRRSTRRSAVDRSGDIWIANDDGSGVARLTDHRARDVYPRFSPDGAWIAFSSNREGNYDVYVMSAKGGKPKQLTYHSADDTVIGWTPDGKRILFSSSRGNGAFPGVGDLPGFSFIPRQAKGG